MFKKIFWAQQHLGEQKVWGTSPIAEATGLHFKEFGIADFKRYFLF